MNTSKKHQMTKIFFIGILLLPNLAYAYIDPGTGILFWQGLIAAIGGVLAFVKSPIKVLKKFLARLISNKNRNNGS